MSLYLIHDFGLGFGVIVIILPFPVGGGTCTDNGDRAVCPGEEAGHQPLAGESTCDDDLTHFLLRMFEVMMKKGVAIGEDGRGFVEGDAIFLLVARCFFRIPFEFEWFLFWHAGEYSILKNKKVTVTSKVTVT